MEASESARRPPPLMGLPLGITMPAVLLIKVALLMVVSPVTRMPPPGLNEWLFWKVPLVMCTLLLARTPPPAPLGARLFFTATLTRLSASPANRPPPLALVPAVLLIMVTAIRVSGLPALAYTPPPSFCEVLLEMTR